MPCDLLWTKDANGTLIDCNEPFARWVGIEVRDARGASEADLLDASVTELLRSQALAALQQGGSVARRQDLVAASGETHAFDIATTVLGAGAPPLLCVVARDLNWQRRERASAHRRLAVAEAVRRMQTRLDASDLDPDAVARLLLETVLTATDSHTAHISPVSGDFQGELTIRAGYWASRLPVPGSVSLGSFEYASLMRERLLEIARSGEPLLLDAEPAWDLGSRDTGAEEPCAIIPLDRPTLAVLVLYGRAGGYSAELLEDWLLLLTSLKAKTIMLLQLIERNETQQALRDSEERYRLLAENARDLVFLHDLNGRVTYSGRASREHLGIDPEDLIGIHPRDLIHPDDHAAAVGTRDKTLPRSYELRWRRFDGGWRWMESRVMPRYGPEGTLIGYHSIARNIDSRKRNEQWLQLARATLESAIDAFYWIGPDGHIAYANPAACETLGYSLEELQRMPLSAFVSSATEAHIQEVLAGLAPGVSSPLWASHQHHIRRDGRRIDVEGSLTRITIDGIDYLCGCVRDITERNRIHERLLLYSTVFESSRESIALISRDGLYLDINEAGAATMGMPREKIIGRPSSEIFPYRNDDVLALVKASLLHKGHWSGEIQQPQPDGSIRTHFLSASGVRDVNGEFSHWVCTSSDISELKMQQVRLQQLAHFDALTGLPNRVLLADRVSQALAQARQSNSVVALCYLDLDGFKRVNDEFGHRAGDELLVKLAERLVHAVREGDTVARLGGDEFVLVLTGLADDRQGEMILDRLLKNIAEPVDLSEGVRVQISGSLGITYYPSDDAEPESLLRHADQAMYIAKNAGPNRYHIFDAEIERAARERQQARMEFAEALQRGELQLYYEPVIDMRRGVVLGVEALLRWHHPVRGVLAPGNFLFSIDSTEDLVVLGERVIRSAGRQLAAWEREGIDFTISVNLSAQHLQQANFADRLEVLLHGLSPSCRSKLNLEIVETAAFKDIDALAATMHSCRALGPAFSLDDFGTGYSSLTYLRQLPASSIKIDRSFVAGVIDGADDRALVKGIIALAESFGRRVIGEGVETIEHGRALFDLGCDIAQGYGIARAMPPEQFPAWLESFEHSAWKHLGDRAEVEILE